MTELNSLFKMDARELVSQLHPISEASHNHIFRAADEMGELARYLVHATLPERYLQTLPHPASIDALVIAIRYTLGVLPQLLEQISQRLNMLGDDPRLDTDSPNDGIPAPERALDAAEKMASAADILRTAAESFGRINTETSHLKFKG